MRPVSSASSRTRSRGARQRSMGSRPRRRAVGSDGVAVARAAQVDAASEAICRATGFEAILLDPTAAVAAVRAVSQAALCAPRDALAAACSGLSPSTSLLARARDGAAADVLGRPHTPSRHAAPRLLCYYGL